MSQSVGGGSSSSVSLAVNAAIRRSRFGAREVGLSTDHEYYRTREIVADVSNCYLIQFDQLEADQLPPMELLTLKELSGRCQNCGQKLANLFKTRADREQ